MKAIVVGAPHSNSGKTMTALALSRAFVRAGYSVQPCKCGPDYIDAAYQAMAARRPARNLDIHLQTKEGMRRNLASASADIAVIEGVMGYFDGMGNTLFGSTFDIARSVGASSILVWRPQGEMYTLVPKLRGMIACAEGTVAGVILNRVREKTYRMLREVIERDAGVPVFGYLPEDARLEIPSRSLGLIRPFEWEEAERRMDTAADLLRDCVSLDAIIATMRDIEPMPPVFVESLGLVVAVARDDAFSSHYAEHLDFWSKVGRMETFSPVANEPIPPCDLVVLGGGYPELHDDALARAERTRQSLARHVEEGGHVLAYGGGLLYAATSFAGKPMAGILPGRAEMGDSLCHFGYHDLSFEEGTPFAGSPLPVREFHRFVYTPEAPTCTVGFSRKPDGSDGHPDGFLYGRVFGMSSHFHIAGWRERMGAYLAQIARDKGKH